MNPIDCPNCNLYCKQLADLESEVREMKAQDAVLLVSINELRSLVGTWSAGFKILALLVGPLCGSIITVIVGKWLQLHP